MHISHTIILAVAALSSTCLASSNSVSSKSRGLHSRFASKETHSDRSSGPSRIQARHKLKASALLVGRGTATPSFALTTPSSSAVAAALPTSAITVPISEPEFRNGLGESLEALGLGQNWVDNAGLQPALTDEGEDKSTPDLLGDLERWMELYIPSPSTVAPFTSSSSPGLMSDSQMKDALGLLAAGAAAESEFREIEDDLIMASSSVLPTPSSSASAKPTPSTQTLGNSKRLSKHRVKIEASPAASPASTPTTNPSAMAAIITKSMSSPTLRFPSSPLSSPSSTSPSPTLPTPSPPLTSSVSPSSSPSASASASASHRTNGGIKKVIEITSMETTALVKVESAATITPTSDPLQTPAASATNNIDRESDTSKGGNTGDGTCKAPVQANTSPQSNDDDSKDQYAQPAYYEEGDVSATAECIALCSIAAQTCSLAVSDDDSSCWDDPDECTSSCT